MIKNYGKIVRIFKKVKRLIWSKHIAIIIKGLISQIPWVGPIIAEYIPIPQDASETVLDSSYGWRSESGESSFTVDSVTGLCVQMGVFSSTETAIVNITFPTSFGNTSYFFSWEPQNLEIRVLQKEVTGIRLQIIGHTDTKAIFWSAKGYK